MQDIKINTAEKVSQKKELGRNRMAKLALALLFLVITVGAIMYFYTNNRNKSVTNSASKISPDYYAVFLDNDQVYFGKIVSKSNEEITLTSVYYIQAASASPSPKSSDPNNQRFTLIKLGTELHDPTEEMMINMEHVVFYEKLRENSKVVESIKNQN
jgi:hypothetical protein